MTAKRRVTLGSEERTNADISHIPEFRMSFCSKSEKRSTESFLFTLSFESPRAFAACFSFIESRSIREFIICPFVNILQSGFRSAHTALLMVDAFCSSRKLSGESFTVLEEVKSKDTFYPSFLLRYCIISKENIW